MHHNKYMKSAERSDLTFVNSLLIFAMCAFDFVMTLSTLYKLIGKMTCFLDSLLVVILILGLFFLVLFNTMWIFSNF